MKKLMLSTTFLLLNSVNLVLATQEPGTRPVDIPEFNVIGALLLISVLGLFIYIKRKK